MKKKLINLITVLVLVGMVGMASATPIVDQSNLYTSGTASGPSVSSDYFLAQTVMNGIPGRLAILELNVTRHTSTSEPLIVQIRGSVNNEPSDDVLIEKVIDPSDVNYRATSTLYIDFSQDNLLFNNGDVFSIVLHSKNDIASEFNWWMPSGIDYQGGNAYSSLDNGTSWVPITSPDFFDFGFQTFIEPSPVPESLSCAGFEPPCDSPDVALSVKKNKCVPLKTELFDNEGFPVTDADIEYPPVLILDTFSGANQPPATAVIDGLSAGEATVGNQFEFIGGRWCFNLKVKDHYSGSGTYTFKMVSGNQGEYIIEPTCTVTILVE